MKSTGLFGKNSGRVGGVVYSNYRGEQVVRTYQPKVFNPNSARQVAQRAKFKLVSQVSASLAREINLSFVPSVAKESNRNAFVKAMLKKTVYNNNQAALPIEDIMLTNSRVNGFSSITATSQQISGVLTSGYTVNARVKIVVIGYNDGGEIILLASQEAVPTTLGSEGLLSFNIEAPSDIIGYTNIRALVYVYEPDMTSGTTYEDYEVLSDEATLGDVLRIFSGRVSFSETQNLLVPRNV